MHVNTQRMRSFAGAVMLLLGVAGCGCDTWGCYEGLDVSFDKAPATPWRVDLLVNGVVQEPLNESTCDGTRQCNPGVHYNIQPRKGVSVRVTTPAGTRTTDFPSIAYKGAGQIDRCHNCKGQAEITALVP